MPVHEVNSFSQTKEGIVTNRPTDKVIWADGRNIKFTKSETVSKKLGTSALASLIGAEAAALDIRALFTFLGVDNVRYTIACTDTTIYAYSNDGNSDFASVADITEIAHPPTTPITSPAVWTFALVAGTLIISNDIDPYWIWKASGLTYPATLTQQTIIAKTVASFQNRLALGNIREGGVTYTGRMRWSAIGQPDLLTISTANKTGYKDFLGKEHSEDAVETILVLSEPFVFTKERIYKASPLQDPWTFRFEDAIANIGIVAPKAIAHFAGTHYFMARDDFYSITEGGTIASIGFNIRNACFPNLNKAKMNTAFATYSYTNKEIHFHVPIGSSLTPNLAFVYNVEFKNWSIEEIAYNARTIAYQGTTTQWDSLNPPFGSWDAATDTDWTALSDSGIIPYEVIGKTGGKIEKVDDTFNEADGTTPITAFIETGDIVGKTRLQDKHVREIWPFFKPQATTSALTVEVGVRESLANTIVWSAPQNFTIGVDKKVTFRERGKYYRVRFQSTGLDTPWALAGYEIKYFNGGFR